MLKQQQQEVLSNFSQNIPDSLNPLNNLPKMEGLDQWQKMQANFLNQMMGPIATSMGTSMGNDRSTAQSESEVEEESSSDKTPKRKSTKKASAEKDQDIEAMKKQLADLQSKLQDM